MTTLISIKLKASHLHKRKETLLILMALMSLILLWVLWKGGSRILTPISIKNSLHLKWSFWISRRVTFSQRQYCSEYKRYSNIRVFFLGILCWEMIAFKNMWKLISASLFLVPDVRIRWNSLASMIKYFTDLEKFLYRFFLNFSLMFHNLL